MTCTNCGKPAHNLLCDNCQYEFEVRLYVFVHETRPAIEEQKARRNKRARQLRQLKKVKQRTLEFE